MKRRSFLKRSNLNQDMNLQITSMADIFTIILIFMLKSYGNSGMPAEVTQNLQVPQAIGKYESTEAIKLEISKNTVALQGHAVVNIQDYRFNSSDLNSNGSSKRLSQALAQERGKASGEDSSKLKVLVLADQHAPYSTIKAVLASAAVQGFTDIKLAVSDAQ